MKEYLVKLERISSDNNNLRSNKVEGTCLDLPQSGRSFVMFGEPIDSSKDVRWVMTSVVQEVQKDEDVVQFTTMNSEYKLVILDDNFKSGL